MAVPSLYDPTMVPYVFELLGTYTVRPPLPLCPARLVPTVLTNSPGMATMLCWLSLSLGWQPIRHRLVCPLWPGGAGQVTAMPSKFLVSATLIYHYLGAIRHVYWDNTAKGLTNKEAEQSSLAVIGGTLIGSIGACMI